MKEDLNMSGNQITKINTIFTCGFVFRAPNRNRESPNYGPVLVAGISLEWCAYFLRIFNGSALTKSSKGPKQYYDSQASTTVLPTESRAVSFMDT
jgi:hypothetical protein